MRVKTVCKCCHIETGKFVEKMGTAYPYQINTDAFFVTILFDDCGHKQVKILNQKQLNALEVKDG